MSLSEIALYYQYANEPETPQKIGPLPPTDQPLTLSAHHLHHHRRHHQPLSPLPKTLLPQMVRQRLQTLLKRSKCQQALNRVRSDDRLHPGVSESGAIWHLLRLVCEAGLELGENKIVSKLFEEEKERGREGGEDNKGEREELERDEIEDQD